MSAFESLPPDQRAVLQLILKQGRGYAALSGLLRIDEDAVRARAHAGLDALAPAGAGSALTPERRGQIADYLLGQQDDAERAVTLQHLQDSRAARRWAGALHDRLAPLANGSLPDLPGARNGAAPRRALAGDTAATEADEPASPASADSTAALEPAPTPIAADATAPEPTPTSERSVADPTAADERSAYAPDRPDAEDAHQPPAPPPAPADAPSFGWDRRDPAPQRSSKLGGLLLIGGVAALIVVVLIIVIGGSGDSDEPTASTPAPQTQAQAQRTTADRRAAADDTTILQQVNLRPPGGGDAPLGVAYILLRDSRPVVAVQVQDIPANGEGDVYAAWLRQSTGARAKFLGYVPGLVGADGRFVVSATLPRDTADYDQVVVSRESSNPTSTPTRPAAIVLQGPLRVNRTG